MANATKGFTMFRQTHHHKLDHNRRLPTRPLALTPIRLLATLLLLMSTLPGCDAAYYDWIEDFREDYADIDFEAFTIYPEDPNGSSKGVKSRMAACEPLEITKEYLDVEDDGIGGGSITYWTYYTYFFVLNSKGQCEVHQFYLGRSKSRGGLGCDSSKQRSTYAICYGGMDKDCELIDESRS